MVIIHHTDADREYAYDRQSEVGTLDKALNEATAKGWIVVDMKRDWKTIFAPSRSGTGGPAGEAYPTRRRSQRR